MRASRHPLFRVGAALLATAGAAWGGSLPSVTSGARPGPDVLYAPAPPAPQLENRNPRFTAPPLLVSGQEAYVAGEYLYQDFLYDDYGSDTAGQGATGLSPRGGDIKDPPNAARYGGNAAERRADRPRSEPDHGDRAAHRLGPARRVARDPGRRALRPDDGRMAPAAAERQRHHARGGGAPRRRAVRHLQPRLPLRRGGR